VHLALALLRVVDAMTLVNVEQLVVSVRDRVNAELPVEFVLVPALVK
jgi:hypothetical protein